MPIIDDVRDCRMAFAKGMFERSFLIHTPEDNGPPSMIDWTKRICDPLLKGLQLYPRDQPTDSPGASVVKRCHEFQIGVFDLFVAK